MPQYFQLKAFEIKSRTLVQVITQEVQEKKYNISSTRYNVLIAGKIISYILAFVSVLNRKK